MRVEEGCKMRVDLILNRARCVSRRHREHRERVSSMRTLFITEKPQKSIETTIKTYVCTCVFVSPQSRTTGWLDGYKWTTEWQQGMRLTLWIRRQPEFNPSATRDRTGRANNSNNAASGGREPRDVITRTCRLIPDTRVIKRFKMPFERKNVFSLYVVRFNFDEYARAFLGKICRRNTIAINNRVQLLVVGTFLLNVHVYICARKYSRNRSTVCHLPISLRNKLLRCIVVIAKIFNRWKKKYYIEY